MARQRIGTCDLHMGAELSHTCSERQRNSADPLIHSDRPYFFTHTRTQHSRRANGSDSERMQSCLHTRSCTAVHRQRLVQPGTDLPTYTLLRAFELPNLSESRLTFFWGSKDRLAAAERLCGGLKCRSDHSQDSLSAAQHHCSSSKE